MNHFTQRLMAFLYLGVILVILMLGFFIFSWILLMGALVGLVLFIIARVRHFFIAKKNFPSPKKPSSGRVIDHDEIE